MNTQAKRILLTAAVACVAMLTVGCGSKKDEATETPSAGTATGANVRPIPPANPSKQGPGEH